MSSWDLAGRPYALVRETGTYRRGLDGGLLWKREATADGPRLRRRLSAAEGEPIVEAARREARGGSCRPEGLRSAGPRRIRRDRGSFAPVRRSSQDDRAVHRLATIVAMDGAALRDDAARFLAASGPVGILPPDQYLALVVRVTEGCSWNACTFCRLYRDVPFRWKRPDELVAHLAALRAVLRPLDRPAPLRVPRRRERPLPRPRPPPPARGGRGRAAPGRAPLLLPRRLDRPAQDRGRVARLRRPSASSASTWASRRATRASSRGSRSPAPRRTPSTSSGRCTRPASPPA